MSSGFRKDLQFEARGAALRSAISNRLHRRRTESDDESETSEPDLSATSSEIPSTEYQHTALSHTDWIRLLSLQPGHGRDPVRCLLAEADFAICGRDGHPGYDALSYVWGSPEAPVRIQINESGLAIGRNLFQALVDIRRPDEARLLWVDAICIDQANTQEKNTQVPLMKDIYSRARQTLCYLGPRKPKMTRRCYAMLKELAEEAKTLPPQKQATAAAPDAIEAAPAFVNHVQITPVASDLARKYAVVGADGIAEMAACTWWQRAWTVQELLLSPRPVIMTGRFAIAWEDARAAADYGLNLQLWGPTEFGFFLDLVSVPYLSTRALDTQLRLRKQRAERFDTTAAVRDFLHVLTQCRYRESQNPRDKVYAFLGLLRDTRARDGDGGADDDDDAAQLRISVDYNSAVRDVYRQVSTLFLQYLQNLDVLGVCPASPLPGRPSWVTDWSVSSPQATPLSRDSLDRIRTTHATCKTLAGCRFTGEGARTMVLNGHVLSSVAQVSGTLPFANINTDMQKLDPVAKEQRKDILGRYIHDAEPENSSKVPGFLGQVQKVHDFVAVRSEIFGWVMAWGHRKLQKMVLVFTTLIAWEKFVTAGPPSKSNDKLEQGAGIDAYHYWQTVCAGTYKDGNEEATRAHFQEWSDSLNPVREYVEKHPKYPEEQPGKVFMLYLKSSWDSYSDFWPYITCAQHRRLGWAEDGQLCLLPAEAQVGDSIILACGGRAPLIVRAREDGSAEFIGEAYVHGVMDGEAFRQNMCHDIEIN